MLPLFAVIDKQIFVVHAGLPRSPTTLEKLRHVELLDHFPAPRSKEDLRKGTKSDWSEQDTIVFDAQWADPHEGTGIVSSKRGGDAVKFGSDITEHFLKESGLQLLVRSHEAAPRRSRTERPPGFWWAHGRRLLTVFSASNYGGQYQNLGAVAIFRKQAVGESLPEGLVAIGDLSLELDQYYAPVLAKISASVLEQKDHTMAAVDKVLTTRIRQHNSTDGPNLWTEQVVPKELLHYAVGIMCTYRERLWSFCNKRAENGRVPIEDLSKELNHLCEGPGIPWSWLLREEEYGLACSLRTPDSMEYEAAVKTTVNYERLLGRFYVHWPVLDKFEIVQGVERLRRLIHKVLFAELTTEEAIDLFDVNGNGIVLQSDCRHILQRLIPALSERQVHHAMTNLPWSKEGDMPIERCLLHLHLKYGNFPPPADPFLLEVLPKMMVSWSKSKLETDDEVVAFGEKLFQVFREIDEGNGVLEKNELLPYLHRTIPMTELGFDAESDESLFQYLDITRSATVNIFELFHAVACASRGLRGARGDSTTLPSTVREDLFCSFNALVGSHRTVLLSACRAMDYSFDGKLPRERLMAAMRALLEALPQSAEIGTFEMQLEALESVLPESVKYEELLGDFEIIDSFQR